MVFTGTSVTDFYTLKTQINTLVTVNYLLKKNNICLLPRYFLQGESCKNITDH